MGKSKRFHKRVQKRHTRKHKQTRKKNKMNKNYSRKQRGGNPVVGLTIGTVMATMVAIGSITAALSERRGAIGASTAALSERREANMKDKEKDNVIKNAEAIILDYSRNIADLETNLERNSEVDQALIYELRRTIAELRSLSEIDAMSNDDPYAVV